MEKLKDEINKSLETLHDITKWKLIIVSALCATALGMTGATTGAPQYRSLLLLIPFVCAYSDLNFYQNLVRIFVLNRFMRAQRPTDQDALLLANYERFADMVRSRCKGAFNLDRISQVASSSLFSLAPVFVFVIDLFGYGREAEPVDAWRGAFWAIGTTLVGYIYYDFLKKEEEIKRLSDEDLNPFRVNA